MGFLFSGRNVMKQWRGLVVAIGLLSIAGKLKAEETPPSSVEERLSILERKYEVDQEAAAARAPEAATLTAGKDGVEIKTSDGNFSLRLSGYLQVDYRDYLDDQNQFADQFLLRQVRTIFSGTVRKVVDYRIMTDFANGGGTTAGPTSTLLQDAYVEWKPKTWARVRGGKFKSPVGLERLRTDSSLSFVERSLTVNLVPNRDTGVELLGDVADGAISYQAGVLNGVPDGASGESDANDGKDYEGRVFVQPFKAAGSDWVNGLGAGVAVTLGDQLGTAATGNLTSGLRTDGQQTFFTYQNGTFANGRRRRVVPQGHWYVGSFGLLGEYVSSSQDVRRVSVSTGTATLTHRAWQIAGSWVLSGERASFAGVKPLHSWGAIEATGRYAILVADAESFDNGGFFANPATSARKARSWAAGLNWYAASNVRALLDYDVTSFVGGGAGGNNRPTEEVILTRVQVSF
jgi:phosphate-selective porin OprO/OprP